MQRWQKASLTIVAVVLLLAGFVAFVLPGIVKSQAVKRVEAATGRKLAIGGISINPFTWTIAVRDLRFSERGGGGGETFATFSSARIAVSPSSLYRRAPIIASARITSPHLHIVRVGANTFNFSDLLQRKAEHPQQPRFSLNNLMITNGSVDFIDQGLPIIKRHELRRIELAVPFITTIPYLADRYITPRLSLVVNGSPLHLEGRLRPFPKAVEANATIAFDDAALPHYLAYLPERLPVQVQSGRMSAKVAMSYRAAEKENPGLSFNGTVTLADTKVADRKGAPLLGLQQLNVAAKVGIGGPEGTRLETGSIQASQLSISAGKGEGINLASLSLEGGTYSRKQNLLEVADLTLRNGRLRFSRDRQGIFLPLPFLHQGAGRKKAAQPLRYRIGRISGAGLDIAFLDEKLAGGQRFTLKNATLSLEKFIGPPFGMIPFRVAGGYGKGGSLKASGSFCPAPLKIKGHLVMQRIPITDFDAYFPEDLDVFVTGGRLDARLDLSLAGGGGPLTGTFDGSAQLRSFNCLDREGEALLRWEMLHVDRVKGRLAPFALDIGDVAVTGFYSRIVAQKDGSLNLQHLYRKEPKATDSKTVGGKKRAMVRIGRVTMQSGTLSFTDHHVAGGYSTTFFNLGGRVSGLSSEPNRLADVELRGNLENQSPLRITGQINPLRGDLFVDLKVRFTDIALSPMSAYAGKYLGYAVENGQLFIYSRYRIEKKQLVSENKIVIDQLDFGRRIESDKATSLPVRLAIALLKDKNGEITLDLPVTGRTDDPHFSFPGMVLKILKNLLVTAARSPLTLLHAMFGGKEPPDSVGFTPGSAALSPVEREKLLQLAAAFNNRPALKIAVTGLVDRDRDDEGYRNELLLKRMRTEKFLDLVKERGNQPDDSADTMHIAPEEYPRYLKEVYAKEQFPKPRNILGLVKALPEAEMKKLILANILVGEEQLRGVADARAAAVRAFLVEQGKVDSRRVFQKSGDIYRSPAKRGENGSRVEFELTTE